MKIKKVPAASRRKFRVVLVPPLHAEGMLPLAAGLLKAYAMRDPFLRRRAEIIILEPWASAAEAPDRVSALKPDLAGFTMYGGLDQAKAAAAEIKRRCGAKIIFGGPLLDAVSMEEMFAGGAVDFAVKGEGEETFSETLKALVTAGELSGIKGLSFLSGGAPVVNPHRKPPAELSGLPSPYLAKIFKWRGYARVPFELTRGCRQACLYCTLPASYRSFGLKRVKAELARILKDFPKLRTLFLTDPDLCQSPEMPRLLELLAGEAASWGINTEIQLNPLNLDERMAPLMNDRAFSFGAGVQSIFPDTCRQVNRRMDFAALERKAELLSAKAPRAKLVLSFILGLPGDTYEKSLANFEWGLSHNLGLFFHRLRVYPCSPLGRLAGKARIKVQKSEPYYALSVPSLDEAGLRRVSRLARELSLAANIVFADKYFGFLFRYMTRARSGAGAFPRVELCRRINRFARADKGLAAAAAQVEAFPDDGDWSGLDSRTFEERRGALIRGLAAMETGGQARRAFAARFADFCEARLLWERVDGSTAGRILSMASGGSVGGPSLLVCGAGSSDPAKLSGCGFSLELLVEEKFGFFPVPPAGRRVWLDRTGMASGIRTALKAAGKFSSIVVSQVLSALPGDALEEVLKGLLLSAGYGARLYVIDSGLGYPEFGPDWELTGGWLDCPPSRLEAGLRAAGWRIIRTVPLGKWRVLCAERA